MKFLYCNLITKLILQILKKELYYELTDYHPKLSHLANDEYIYAYNLTESISLQNCLHIHIEYPHWFPLVNLYWLNYAFAYISSAAYFENQRGMNNRWVLKLLCGLILAEIKALYTSRLCIFVNLYLMIVKLLAHRELWTSVNVQFTKLGHKWFD